MSMVKKIGAVVLAFVMLLPAAVRADENDVLILPNDLKRIESRAFADVEAGTIRFPDGIEFIADNAFGTAISTWQGSWNNTVARTWCDEHGWRWKPEHCYALIVGNSVYDFMGTLASVSNDVRGISSALRRLDGNWEVTVMENASCPRIREAIRTTFANATSSDLCLFYFSGHGDETDSEQAGSIFGITSFFGWELYTTGEGDFFTPAQLRDCLSDATPGPVSVVIDACGSGASIYSETMTARGAETGGAVRHHPGNFTQAVVSAFSSGTASDQAKSGELRNAEKFSVLTACAFNETSMGGYLTEGFVNSVIQQLEADPSLMHDDDFGVALDGGAFTYALVQAMGFHYPDCSADNSLSGDTNGDGMLTLSETFFKVSGIVRNMDRLWRRLVDYMRRIVPDEELTAGHSIEALYDLYSQTPRMSGYGSNILFWLPVH